MALELIRAFARGDGAAMRPLLHEDLKVSGLLLEVASGAAWLEALRADPPEPANWRIREVEEHSAVITILWELDKPRGPLEICQEFGFQGVRIRRMALAFDTRRLRAPSPHR